MKYQDPNLLLEETGAAALWVQFFSFYLALLLLFKSPSADHWNHADPILKILPQSVTLWLIVFLAAFAGLVFPALRRPSGSVMLTSLWHALAGAALAGAMALFIRLIFGPELPSFIPPEESVKPGFVLGMAAGLGEEVIFRFTLIPLLFITLSKKMKAQNAAILAVVITSLLFALLHEVGVPAELFSWQHFITRVLVPGCLMGAAFFVISPSFIVIAHCGAHIMIPLLFQ